MINIENSSFNQVIHITSRSFRELGTLLLSGLTAHKDIALHVSCRNGIDLLIVNELWAIEIISKMKQSMKNRTHNKSYAIKNETLSNFLNLYQSKNFPELTLNSIALGTFDADAILINEKLAARLNGTIFLSESLAHSLIELSNDLTFLSQPNTLEHSDLSSLKSLKAI